MEMKKVILLFVGKSGREVFFWEDEGFLFCLQYRLKAERRQRVGGSPHSIIIKERTKGALGQFLTPFLPSRKKIR